MELYMHQELMKVLGDINKSIEKVAAELATANKMKDTELKHKDMEKGLQNYHN